MQKMEEISLITDGHTALFVPAYHIFFARESHLLTFKTINHTTMRKFLSILTLSVIILSTISRLSKRRHPF